MELSGELHAPAALPMQKEPPGAVEERKILHFRELKSGRTARSPLPYRLLA
jgi:hypothetical protein